MRGMSHLPIAALCAALSLAYGPMLGAGFVNWDDNRFIVDNPLFRDGGWSYIRAAFTEVQFEAYHPLHLLSYLPDRYLWPNWPVGFHLVNLALYFVLAAVAFRLARRVTGDLAAALACAVVLFHPICVESVAWVSARKDVLATLLFVLTLAVDDRHWTGNQERPYWRKIWPGLVLFLCALLTKTSTICYPVALLAWLRWMRGTAWRNAIPAVLPHLALATAAAFVVLHIWSSSEMIGQSRPITVWLDVPASYAVFVRHLVWPAGLAAIYAGQPQFYLLGGVAVLAVVAAAAATWRMWPGPAKYGAIAFVAALLPVANLIPVYYRYSDRYVFLAWVLCIVPMAAALDHLFTRWNGRVTKKAGLAGLAALILILAVATCNQVHTWQDSRRLWAHCVSAQPDAYLARLKYGETLRVAQSWRDAVAEYQAAIRLEPGRALAYVGLFYLYAKQAEADGRITAATADRWLRAVGPALRGPQQLQRFRNRVLAAGCVRCDRLLLLLSLRQSPVNDADLQANAKRALAAGQYDVALIYLNEVQNRDQADFQALWRAALQHSQKR